MDMNLDNFIIINNEKGVPEFVEVVTKTIIVKVPDVGGSLAESHHDFGTVAKLNILSSHMTSNRLMMLGVDHFAHIGWRCLKFFRSNIVPCQSR